MDSLHHGPLLLSPRCRLLQIRLLFFALSGVIFLIASNFALEGIPVSGLDQSSSITNFILFVFSVVAAPAVTIVVAIQASGEAKAVHLEALRLVAPADYSLFLIRFLMPEYHFLHLFLQLILLQYLLFALSSLTRHFLLNIFTTILVVLTAIGSIGLFRFSIVVRIGAQQVSAYPLLA